MTSESEEIEVHIAINGQANDDKNKTQGGVGGESVSRATTIFKFPVVRKKKQLMKKQEV